MAMLILSHILKCYKEMIEIKVSRAYKVSMIFLILGGIIGWPYLLGPVVKIVSHIFDWHFDRMTVLMVLGILSLVMGVLVFYFGICRMRIGIADKGKLVCKGGEEIETVEIPIDEISKITLKSKLGYTRVTVTHGGKLSKLYPQDAASFVALLLERNKDIEVFNG